MVRARRKTPRVAPIPWETVLSHVLFFLYPDESMLSTLLLVSKAWYHELLRAISNMASSTIHAHESSPFSKLLFLATRTLHRASESLYAKHVVVQQMELVCHERHLLDQLETLSYTASCAALQRVSDLIQREHNMLHSPIHLDVATIRDMLVRHAYPSAIVAEIMFWLQWRRENFMPVAFGDVCLSFGCTAPQCCMARARTSPFTPHVSTLHHLQSAVPVVLWPSILAYLPYSAVDTIYTLTRVSPHLKSYFLNQPLLGPIIAHCDVKRALHALEAQKHLAYGLHELQLAALQYKASFETLRHTLAQSNYSLQHAMVREFFQEASQYAETKSSQHLRMLVQLDRSLLQTFGVDARTLEQPCVTQLPPRAFFQPVTVATRRNFQLPVDHESAQYDGQKHRFLIHTQRLALTEARRTMWTALRRIEAFELQMPQRVMHDIRSFQMLAPLSSVAKQLADPQHNSMVAYDTIHSVTFTLATRLERGVDVDTAVVDAVTDIRRLLATTLTTIVPSLYSGYVSDVAAPSCDTWHKLALKLATETSRVSMSLSVAADDGFRMIFEERHRLWWPRVKPVPVRVLVAPLQIIGLFPLSAPTSDLRIQDADVWVVFTLKDAGVTVVRKNNEAAAHLLHLFNITSLDVFGALHLHGMITGRCAPCSHVLKHGQTIGAKCKARLEVL